MSVELALLYEYIEGEGSYEGMRLGGQRKHSPAEYAKERSQRRSAVGWRSNLVSFDSGDKFRQGGALGVGKIVQLLVRCIASQVLRHR